MKKLICLLLLVIVIGVNTASAGYIETLGRSASIRLIKHMVLVPQKQSLNDDTKQVQVRVKFDEETTTDVAFTQKKYCLEVQNTQYMVDNFIKGKTVEFDGTYSFSLIGFTRLYYYLIEVSK